VSLKESSRLIEEAKEREVQMQNKLKAMEQRVQILNDRDQEVNTSVFLVSLSFPSYLKQSVSCNKQTHL